MVETASSKLLDVVRERQLAVDDNSEACDDVTTSDTWMSASAKAIVRVFIFVSCAALPSQIKLLE